MSSVMFEELVSDIFNKSEVKKNSVFESNYNIGSIFGDNRTVGSDLIQSQSRNIMDVGSENMSGNFYQPVDNKISYNVGSISGPPGLSQSVNTAYTQDERPFIEKEYERLNKENRDLYSKYVQLRNFQNILSNHVLQSGFSDIGKVFEASKKYKDIVNTLEINGIQGDDSISEAINKVSKYKLLELELEKEKVKSSIFSKKLNDLENNYSLVVSEKEDTISVLEEQIAELQYYCHSTLNLGNDNSEELSEASGNNNEHKSYNKVTGWDKISENLCIDLLDNRPKDITNVRARIKRILNDAGIPLTYLIEERVVIPKSNIEGKYKCFGYLRFDSHNTARMKYDLILQNQKCKFRVSFSRPNSSFK